MNSQMEILANMLSRGVNVTIITNECSESPDLKLNWQYKDYWWGEEATFVGAGYKLRVVDRDGDSSDWEIKKDQEIIAQGDNWDYDPYYHFDACLLAAEQALREHVLKRINEIKSTQIQQEN